MIERKKKVQLILMIMKNQHSLNAQQELNKVYQWVNITHLILDSDQILKPSHHSLILLRHWCIHQVLVLLIWNCKMTIIILVEEGVLQLVIVVYHLLLELEVNLPNTISFTEGVNHSNKKMRTYSKAQPIEVQRRIWSLLKFLRLNLAPLESPIAAILEE